MFQDLHLIKARNISFIVPYNSTTTTILVQFTPCQGRLRDKSNKPLGLAAWATPWPGFDDILTKIFHEGCFGVDGKLGDTSLTFLGNTFNFSFENIKIYILFEKDVARRTLLACWSTVHA